MIILPKVLRGRGTSVIAIRKAFYPRNHVLYPRYFCSRGIAAHLQFCQLINEYSPVVGNLQLTRGEKWMIHEVRMLLFRFKVIDIFMVNHLYRLEYICVRVGGGLRVCGTCYNFWLNGNIIILLCFLLTFLLSWGRSRCNKFQTLVNVFL